VGLEALYLIHDDDGFQQNATRYVTTVRIALFTLGALAAVSCPTDFKILVDVVSGITTLEYPNRKYPEY
jgi:hypothetical protein